MQPSDTLLINAKILPSARDAEVIPKGWIAITDGRIQSMGCDGDSSDRPPASRTFDLSGRLVMPGLVNAWTSAWWSGAASPLLPAETCAEAISADQLRSSTEAAMLAMIGSGTTAFCGPSPCPDLTASIARQAGLRACFTGNPEQVAARLEKGTEALEPSTWALLPGPDECSAQQQDLIRELCRQPGVRPVIRHPQGGDMGGEVPPPASWHLQDLESRGVLLDGLICCCPCGFTDEDVSRLVEVGGAVIWCPSEFRINSSGPAWNRIVDSGELTVGLGTGEWPRCSGYDLFISMDQAVKLGRAGCLSPTSFPAWRTVEIATTLGTALLNAGTPAEGLVPGAPADLIVLDVSAPHLTPLYSAVSQVVYAARGTDVVSTMVAGKWLMLDRDFLTLDADSITSAHRAAFSSAHPRKGTR